MEVYRINQPVCMQRVIRLLMGIFSFAYNETNSLLISKRKDAYKQTNKFI